MKKETLITAQSSSFLGHALEHIGLAKIIYDRNIERQLIAPKENFNASVSLIDFLIFLESHINRIGYFKKEQEPYFDYDGIKYRLETKIEKVFPECPSNLIEALKEVKETRNAIIHAHLWIEERNYTKDYELEENIFKTCSIASEFRRHFNEVVNFKTFKTKKYSFNIVPTKVNFIDAFKTLLLTEKIVAGLQTKYGRLNVMSYVDPNYPLGTKLKEYIKSHNFEFSIGSLTEWIDLLIKVIHPIDKQELLKFGNFRYRLKIHNLMLQYSLHQKLKKSINEYNMNLSRNEKTSD